MTTQWHPMNATVRLPGSLRERLARFREDQLAFSSKSAAIIHLLDRALAQEGYPHEPRARAEAAGAGSSRRTA